MSGSIDARLADLGITLPEPMHAMGSYTPYVRTGNLLWIAGQGPFMDGKMHYNGTLGDSVTLEDGQACARIVALNIITQARAALDGDLDRIVRFVKLGGFVNCTPDFIDQPKVINGASDVIVEIFGNKGKHARFAVGAPTLPMNTSVEIDAVIEVRD